MKDEKWVIEGPNPETIKDLFGRNVEVYDRANDIISLGLAHFWRRKLVFWSEKEGLKASYGKSHASSLRLKGKRKSILDCATGTGDLAFQFKRIFPSFRVTGCDFCKPMLEKARKKAKAFSLDVEFKFSDLTHLSFEDNTFDVTSVSYGIRNVKNPSQALFEMARVTKSGGKLMILETGDSHRFLMRIAFRFYFKFLVPLLGGWVSGDRKAYEYLSHSSCSFPSGERFVSFLKSTNLFRDIQYRSILGGASFMYKALVI